MSTSGRLKRNPGDIFSRSLRRNASRLTDTQSRSRSSIAFRSFHQIERCRGRQFRTTNARNSSTVLNGCQRSAARRFRKMHGQSNITMRVGLIFHVRTRPADTPSKPRYVFISQPCLTMRRPRLRWTVRLLPRLLPPKNLPSVERCLLLKSGFLNPRHRGQIGGGAENPDVLASADKSSPIRRSRVCTARDRAIPEASNNRKSSLWLPTAYAELHPTPPWQALVTCDHAKCSAPPFGSQKSVAPPPARLKACGRSQQIIHGSPSSE